MEEKKKEKFTPKQLQAINAQGKTIVSASAGSGKTTVMIEKIIRYIREGGKVSEILAVTFTKKAASQMKEKLRKALVLAINERDITAERKRALKRELEVVPTADISTIHSFCARLIRTHFYKAGVDNAFRVIGGDDADGTALKNSALDDLFDEGYDTKDEDFNHLLSVYWRKKSDSTLRKNLLGVYDKLRERADYEAFLSGINEYDESLFDAVCEDLHKILQDKATYYLGYVAEEKAYFEGIQATQQLALCEDLSGALNAILDSPDYFSACALQKPPFTKKSSSKKDSEEKKEHIERLAVLKDKIVKIYDDELSKTTSKAEEFSSFVQSGKTAKAIAQYLLKFDKKYSALKRERCVLDYNDLEHKALALLEDEDVLSALREKYRYVFVDEYQDVNPVQEAIISRVSGEDLFLVGDVKQSIYGFRGSKSRFFVEKKKELEQGDGNSIDMSRNFRSSDAVLDAVNAQFCKAMTLHTSDVDYANGSYMERGGWYEVGDGRVQLHPLKEEEKAEKTQRGVYSVKAHAKEGGVEKSPIAKTIRHIIDWELTQKWYDTERKEYRPVRYSDIAILTRKKQGGISKTVASLTAEGIPVTASSAVNICDFTEIKALIDILSLIDNAEQDVPLCSALLSAMGGLTANDLVEIRLSFKDETFFRVACKRYATERTGELSHRLQRFYQYLQHLRDCACVMNAGEILTKILAETHMESLLLSKENGEASIRRVHRFIEETSVEEPLSVHDFLVRLRNLDYKVEYNENSGEDSVKVITMHASKGLEYPVVILNDISELFHGVDHDEILIEEKYGLAPRSFDENKLIKRGTLLRRLCEKKQQKSTVMDELNLYYVALTRAKYALHIVFGEKSLLQDVRYARSFADFTDFSIWKKYLVEDEIFDVPYAERQALAFNPNKELTNSIMQAFQWEYSHKGLENLPVKSSATQLLGQYVYEEDGREEKVVEAVVEGGTGTSIEAGLAYHAFLERFDFAKLLDGAGNRISKETLVSLIEKEYDAVADKDKKYVSKEKLVEILSNDVFYRLEGMRLYKEQVFLASLPVRDTYAKKADVEESVKAVDEAEEMIFQGAIDLLAVGKNTAWIIDYKYSQKNAEQLKEHYYPQLDLYKKTTAKILKIPEENVRCTIVNIYRGFQVDVE